MTWFAVFGFVAIGNSVVTLMDAGRHGRDLPAWQPVTWEASSAIVALLLLPAVFTLCRRWPLHFDTWLRRLPL